ncbi:CAP Gly-rich domain-containing protein [Phycomyces nitens]|nr:CAP Gly-rich domain-containing protein [Phycomyces nitens]
MALFGLGKSKNRFSTSKLSKLDVRRTKSTGNIESSEPSTTKGTFLKRYTSVNRPPIPRSLHGQSDQDDDNEDEESSASSRSNSLSSESSESNVTIPPKNPPAINITNHDLNEKMKRLTTNDLELLLSMETQARIDAQEERERNAAAEAAREAAVAATPRPSRLKFELPVTPPRSRSPASANAYPRARPVRSLPEENTIINRGLEDKRKKRKSRWTRIMGSDQDSSSSESDEEHEPIQLGSKVRLIRRPLPTIGHVRYIGPLGDGEYIGVELESRVGNNDGSVDGKRYFQTDPHRGIFVKRNELKVV